MEKTKITTILETSNLSYAYSDGKKALEDVNIKFLRGSRSVVLGANGAGKSTLFLLLNGLYRPTSGKIFFDGEELVYSTKFLRKLRSRVGVLFQDPDTQLILGSLREDISFGPMNLGLERKVVEERVERALIATRLEKYADSAVHSLSYGQKRRAGIAGLLAMDPEVLILDEPTAGLDKRSQQELFDLLKELIDQRGISVILSTHDIDLAYSWADYLYLIDSGRVVANCVDCTSAAIFDFFTQGFSKFASCGFVPPQVIELYSELKRVGIFSSNNKGHNDTQYPHSMSELIKIIKEL
ncbi:MAG: energy-coupling factor ABC transporter ATP-binding protein [Oligoflexia bacterium]|nr:energy-coupling factor ABC transporter ATP-binding protein [Oligoflexia bacterium]